MAEKRRFYSLEEWAQLPSEEAAALSDDAIGLGALGASASASSLVYGLDDVATLRAALLEQLGRGNLNPLDRSPERRKRVRTAVDAWLRVPANHGGRLAYSRSLVERLLGEVGLGIVEGLLDDPAISEVKVTDWNQITVEQGGVVVKLDPSKYHFASRDEFFSKIEFLQLWAGRSLSVTRTMLPITLDDGTRITLSGPPTSESGIMIIRRRSPKIYTLDDMVLLGSLTPRMADLIRLYTRAGVGILVSGGSGAGKTTLLEAILGALPTDITVVLIQESNEIRQAALKCTVIWQMANPEDAPGTGQALDVLARGARLYGPQRVIIGEVKGREAADMLDAAVGGTGGPMCTLHSDDAAGAYHSLLAYVLKHPQYQGTGSGGLASILHRIASLFPVCVHMGVVEGTGRRQRFVTQILEVEVPEEGAEAGQLKTREIAAGEVVGGQMVWHDVPADLAAISHTQSVARRLAALPTGPAVATVAPMLAGEKRAQAIELLGQAEDAARLENLPLALRLLEGAAEMDPDHSVILAMRSDLQVRIGQQRSAWLSRLQQLTSQVRARMAAGHEDGVRDLLRAIEAIEVVEQERDALKAEVLAWLEARRELWNVVPAAYQAAVQAAVQGQDLTVVLAWAERLWREGADEGARRTLGEVLGREPDNRRAQVYLETLGGKG